MSRIRQKQHVRINSIICILLVWFCLFASACNTAPVPTKPIVSRPTPTPTPPLVAERELQLNKPITYVALGASDCIGIGAHDPEAEGYVTLIADNLPSQSKIVNLGIGGLRLREALTKTVPEAVENSPQLVTIWLVANDFVAGVSYTQYMDDLEKMLKLLSKETKARIVIGNLPNLTLLPMFDNLRPSQKEYMYQEIVRWNKQIDKLAHQYGTVVVDLMIHQSRLTTDSELISDDGFHPSTKGYAELAQLFWQKVESKPSSS